MAVTHDTASSLRLTTRDGCFRSPTAGQCPGHVQASLIVLPSKYADDFRELCRRNPVPCPLLAESVVPGSTAFPPGVADGIDITTDVPGYNVYRDGKLAASDVPDIRDLWAEDSVAFLIGCSFTFEDALAAAGLPVRHVELNRNVPMYRTCVKLMPAGVFGGNMVVSMRPYRPEVIERVRATTRPYGRTHGEPIAWGWEALETLGVQDISKADFGDAPVIRDGEVPVFWGCGVTPQLAVMGSPDVQGLVLGHAPGKMVCLDLKIKDIVT